MLNLKLRPETENDIAFLQRVYASARAEEMKLVPWSDEQKTEFLNSQFQLQRQHYYQHYSDASFDLIELESQAVGRFYLHRTADHINIMEITVLPEFRRRGIAKTLFQNTMTQAQEARLPVVLHVEQYNIAKLWYERLGFAVCGDTGVYLEMKWQPQIS